MSAGLTLWISHQPLLLHAVSLQPTSYGTINNTFITTSCHSPSFMSVLLARCRFAWETKEKFSSGCCWSFSLVCFFFHLVFHLVFSSSGDWFLEMFLLEMWKSSILWFECHTSGYLLCLFCICSAIICVSSEESHMCALLCNSIAPQLCVCTSNGIHWQNRSSQIQSRCDVNVDLHYRIGAIKVKSFPLVPSGLIPIMMLLSVLACADHLTRLVIMQSVTFPACYSLECVKVQHRYQEMDFEGKLRTSTLQICLGGKG